MGRRVDGNEAWGDTGVNSGREEVPNRVCDGGGSSKMISKSLVPVKARR